MKIEKIHANNLRNDAHFQFHTEFRDLAAEADPPALKIAPQFASYLALYEREDEALKKINKSALTERIHEADLARDEVFTGMVEVNRGMCRHFVPEVQEAAKRLRILFDTYGNVASKPLNEETSAIYNILQELEGKYAADASATGIDKWSAELKSRNIAFEALVKERFSETAAKTDVVLKDARKKTDDAFRQLCDIINVYIVLEGAAKYETFVRTLNAVIAKYAVRRHHHHSSEPRLAGLKDSQEETQTNVGNA